MKKTTLALVLVVLCTSFMKSQNEFITTWKTDNPGASSDNEIFIPTLPGETYNFNVDWGDGNMDTGITESITHAYTNPGTYTVTITEVFPRMLFFLGGDQNKLLTIEQWGTNPWTSMQQAFLGCENLNITNPDIDTPNLSNVTNMFSMFSGCSSFNGDISQWDVSNVVNMSTMFSQAPMFNQNISGWNVSNVEFMDAMFNNVSSFNQDISNWNVGSVTNMSNMFNSAAAFNQDISNWDVNEVEDLSFMFSNATSFNQNLGSWDIGNVTSMTGMFSGIILSTTNYDNTLIGWAMDSSGTTDDDIDDIPTNVIFSGGNSNYCNGETARNMLTDPTPMGFGWTITDAGMDCAAPNEFITTWKTDNPGASSDNEIFIPTLPGETYNFNVDWGDGNMDTGITESITHAYTNPGTYTVTITGVFPRMLSFLGGDQNKLLTIEQWGTNPWTSMQQTFLGCENLNITNPDIDTPNLSNVTNMFSMFSGCSSFNGDISQWDVSNVVNMSTMFSQAPMFNQNISGWNVSNVEFMDAMFNNVSSFNQDISNWNVGSVTNMSNMFNSAAAFNQDISNWDVNEVEDLSFMFFNATSFNQNLGSWDIGNVTSMTGMFSGATLSTANYDNTLIDWAIDSSGIPDDSIDDVPVNITFDGGNSTYCYGLEARDLLATVTPTGFGWTITDAGMDCTTLDNEFITTWKTDNLGASLDNEITIPIVPGEIFNYNVDWGDGNIDTGITESIIHAYTNPGTYTVTITGRFPRMITLSGGDQDKLLTIEQWGTNPWTSMEFAFGLCSNLNIINPDIDIPNLSNVTSMASMFLSCSSFNGNTSQWDVGRVMDMSNMFAGASSFNQSISTWNVSNVTDMTSMFANADSFNQDINGWDVSSVINMTNMFVDALAFDQNLGSWDIGSVTNMNTMFSGVALSLENYDNTLIGWAMDSSGTAGDGIDDIPANITFDGGNSNFCNGETARNMLTDPTPMGFGWTITDAGMFCSPPTAVCTDIIVELGAMGTVNITADQLDGGSFDDEGPVTLEINTTTFTCEDTGSNTVILTVTDNTGNIDTCMATVTVVDVTAPEAICQNITVELDDDGLAVITAADINNGSNDNCSIASMSVSQESFDCSNLGENMVTLTVTDAAGLTDTCMATVTVVDVTAPEAICQNITIELDDDGLAVITATDINNGSNDNCSIASGKF